MSPTGLRRQIGQLLIAGFDGPALTVEIKSLAREFGLGGVILFARNIAEPEQLAELCFEAARLDPDLPLWVSIDQEGGRVARLKSPFTEFPPMSTIGRSGDVGLAGRFARAMALELKAVGVSLDYAPVLDVHTNPKNPVIGDRALSDQPDVVARLGAAVIHALQETGVAACGKHFPGHGDTGTDSHLELPLVEHPIERLRSVEFVPFRAAIDAGVASIMTAHLFLPALDELRPATLSTRIVSGVLREELKFEGLILSDDLEMNAVDRPVHRTRGGRSRGGSRLRRSPHLQRRPRHPGGGARGVDPRGRESGGAPHPDRRRPPAAPAGEGAFPGGRSGRPSAAGAPAPRTDRPRRTPGDRGGDGAIPVEWRQRQMQPRNHEITKKSSSKEFSCLRVFVVAFDLASRCARC